jgi:hypothetical protein
VPSPLQYQYSGKTVVVLGLLQKDREDKTYMTNQLGTFFTAFLGKAWKNGMQREL